MIDRQTLANLVPLVAVAIALAEYLLDHTLPRYASPWFWIALVAIGGLLVLIQVLRFGGARKHDVAKPDYSATTLIRRRSDPHDRG
jgi:protein-S-isoprenylcysteine O-methyltransferase Ste14